MNLNNVELNWRNNMFNNKCETCGGDLLFYEFDEIHTELDNNDVELFTVELCPICDKYEITSEYRLKGGE